jgi:thymidylate synthase
MNQYANDFDRQYLNLIANVLRNGDYQQSRNSKVLQLFSPNPIVVDKVYKTFPILSCRKIPFYKSALETFFFLSGKSTYEAMPEVLRNSWWKPWKNKAEEQNSWGNFYGKNWRNLTTESGKGFDQWKNLIEELCTVVKTGIINRKMVVSLWDKAGTFPQYTKKPSVLDCCHSTALVFNLVPQFETNTFYLDLHHTQRSLDLMCGTGSDLVYSGLLMHLLCNEITERTKALVLPRKLIFSPVNVHIYESHIVQAKELLMLNHLVDSYSPVKLHLTSPIIFSNFKTIEDIKQVATLESYKPQPGQYSFELLG